MTNLYVPCSGRRLASLDVNGHKVLILSADRESLEESLHVCGADRVQKVEVGQSSAELDLALSKLAKRMRGGDIIVAPSHVPVIDLVRQLHDELPWYH